MFFYCRLLAGGVNWGRILTLFSFGYRIAVRVLQLGERIGDFAQTLKNIVTNVVTFIRDTSQGIAHWIASQGGWVSIKNSYFVSLCMHSVTLQVTSTYTCNTVKCSFAIPQYCRSQESASQVCIHPISCFSRCNCTTLAWMHHWDKPKS